MYGYLNLINQSDMNYRYWVQQMLAAGHLQPCGTSQYAQYMQYTQYQEYVQQQQYYCAYRSELEQAAGAQTGLVTGELGARTQAADYAEPADQDDQHYNANVENEGTVNGAAPREANMFAGLKKADDLGWPRGSSRENDDDDDSSDDSSMNHSDSSAAEHDVYGFHGEAGARRALVSAPANGETCDLGADKYAAKADAAAPAKAYYDYEFDYDYDYGHDEHEIVGYYK
ncbi:uncharacterized protein V1510DRAFT_410786 [Dipodascopsis tothii]|uniref:uncharacterized protein n=1 Tax=Dipodascopsis tothii TaxID=44089 RepID=UPI0034CEC99D